MDHPRVNIVPSGIGKAPSCGVVRRPKRLPKAPALDFRTAALVPSTLSSRATPPCKKGTRKHVFTVSRGGNSPGTLNPAMNKDPALVWFVALAACPRPHQETLA